MDTTVIYSLYNINLGWNAAIAMYCGNSMLWKPPPSSTLTSIAVQNICSRVLEEMGHDPAVCSFVAGGGEIGARIARDSRIPLDAVF
mgnify:CR=1 FL=1